MHTYLYLQNVLTDQAIDVSKTSSRLRTIQGDWLDRRAGQTGRYLISSRQSCLRGRKGVEQVTAAMTGQEIFTRTTGRSVDGAG